MRSIETSVDVDASPEAVWDVLTEGETYPNWNPFITRLDGVIEPQRRLTVRVDPPGRMAMTFRPRVKIVEENHRLVWKGSFLVPNLFDGTHEFRIEPLEEGARFVQRETFGGLLVPLLLDEDAVKQGFREMNEALKVRAERRERRDEGVSGEAPPTSDDRLDPGLGNS
jgi:hypothetical protein